MAPTGDQTAPPRTIRLSTPRATGTYCGTGADTCTTRPLPRARKQLGGSVAHSQTSACMPRPRDLMQRPGESAFSRVRDDAGTGDPCRGGVSRLGRSSSGARPRARSRHGPFHVPTGRGRPLRVAAMTRVIESPRRFDQRLLPFFIRSASVLSMCPSRVLCTIVGSHFGRRSVAIQTLNSATRRGFTQSALLHAQQTALGTRRRAR